MSRKETQARKMRIKLQQDSNFPMTKICPMAAMMKRRWVEAVRKKSRRFP